jgi:DnaJ homolog subfamily A member 5
MGNTASSRFSSYYGSSGKQQNQAKSEKSSQPGKKTCYYELLGVESTASPEEIKKSFRVKALQLHPDKNPHRIIEATEEFAAIQHAYQTLSDPHERAWYDRHRESILGLRREVDEDEAPDVEELMHFFRPDAYKGFGDDEGGFFSVYRQLFEYIEEFEVEDGEIGHDFAYTSFGSKNSPYVPSISQFYEKWLSFQSTRKFYHAEKYSEEYADNRRIRRSMAKENQKLRDQHRKEYSETIRELASYIQKRDPRFKSHQEERKREREAHEKARKTELKAKRTKEVESYVEPEWSQTIDDEKLAEMLDQIEIKTTSDASEEDEPEFIFECIVCDKVFKNEKQYKNHSQSKKHKANMEMLGLQELIEEIDEPIDRKAEEVKQPASLHQDEEQELSEADKDKDYLKNPSTEEKEDNISDKEESKEPAEKKKKPRRKPKELVKPETLKCNVCEEEFDSRNQLFKHIESEGHALHIPQQNKKKSKTKKK